ncbi:hypothetical protein Mal15_38500 [Stieleria maiorica]|uniref:Uncharacterized protein n=1 Tax=Stieleria maiorica TaxID=2795974 RepID=A0A5B9MG11_9BACT|nr:hypothetical protein [Stieleria maiorica]QEF99783.1 hypothetical protein Mal15_38500 [Stieleria maiorica]
MRYLLPAFLVVLSGCSSSGPLSWFRRTPVVYHRSPCSHCAPSSATPIGSAVSSEPMVLEGATVQDGIIYDRMLDETVIESRLDPPMSVPSTDSSAPAVESLPTPTPDPET